jgi:hypothetical protein
VKGRGDSSRGRRVPGAAWLMAAATAAMCATACDALGNPPRRWRTDASEVRIGTDVVLTTRSEIVAAKAAGGLRARMREAPHHVDPLPLEGYVALVIVGIAPRGRAFAAPTLLATTFEDDEGRAEVRLWRARPRSPEPSAVFALGFVPHRAYTTLAP